MAIAEVWSKISGVIPGRSRRTLGVATFRKCLRAEKSSLRVFLTSPYYDSGTQPDGQLWPEDEPARVDVYNSLLRQVAADHPGVAYVIDLNQIADPNGHYQATIDKVPVRYTDGVHWTWFGDWWLAPRILPQIYQVGARHGGVVTDATTLTTKTRMTRGSASQMRRSTA